MTGNGRHRTGIFSWLSPRHSRFIPGYENSQLDQKNLGQPCITPGQMSKNSVLDQFLDQERFPVLSLIVGGRNERSQREIWMYFRHQSRGRRSLNGLGSDLRSVDNSSFSGPPGTCNSAASKYTQWVFLFIFIFLFESICNYLVKRRHKSPRTTNR